MPEEWCSHYQKQHFFWFLFFALLYILEKCPVNFSKNSSHCSIHTSCVAPVLIQIAPFNPTCEKIMLSLNKESCLWPNAWYCGTKLITEHLVRYQFSQSFLLTIPKRIWDIIIINYEISICISWCSRAWYKLIDKVFEEYLFLDESSVKIMRNQDYFIIQPSQYSFLLLDSWEWTVFITRKKHEKSDCP